MRSFRTVPCGGKVGEVFGHLSTIMFIGSQSSKLTMSLTHCSSSSSIGSSLLSLCAVHVETRDCRNDETG